MRELCNLCGKIMLDLPMSSERDVAMLYGLAQSIESIILGWRNRIRLVYLWRETVIDVMGECCEKVRGMDIEEAKFCNVLEKCGDTWGCINTNPDVLECVYDLVRIACTSIIRNVFCEKEFVIPRYE